MLNKDDRFFNIGIGDFISTVRNAMHFENVAIVGSHLVNFNRISSTGDDLNLNFIQGYEILISGLSPRYSV